MQIKGLTVNAAGMMPVGAGIQEKKNQMRSAGGMFGPECRVTISEAGRKLSEQQAVQKEVERAADGSVRDRECPKCQGGENASPPAGGGRSGCGNQRRIS